MRKVHMSGYYKSILKVFTKRAPLLSLRLIKAVKNDNLIYARTLINRLNWLARTMHETNVKNGMPDRPFKPSTLELYISQLKQRGLL